MTKTKRRRRLRTNSLPRAWAKPRSRSSAWKWPSRLERSRTSRAAGGEKRPPWGARGRRWAAGKTVRHPRTGPESRNRIPKKKTPPRNRKSVGGRLRGVEAEVLAVLSLEAAGPLPCYETALTSLTTANRTKQSANRRRAGSEGAEGVAVAGVRPRRREWTMLLPRARRRRQAKSTPILPLATTRRKRHKTCPAPPLRRTRTGWALTRKRGRAPPRRLLRTPPSAPCAPSRRHKKKRARVATATRRLRRHVPRRRRRLAKNSKKCKRTPSRSRRSCGPSTTSRRRRASSKSRTASTKPPRRRTKRTRSGVSLPTSRDATARPTRRPRATRAEPPPCTAASRTRPLLSSSAEENRRRRIGRARPLPSNTLAAARRRAKRRYRGQLRSAARNPIRTVSATTKVRCVRSRTGRRKRQRHPCRRAPSPVTRAPVVVRRSKSVRSRRLSARRPFTRRSLLAKDLIRLRPWACRRPHPNKRPRPLPLRRQLQRRRKSPTGILARPPRREGLREFLLRYPPGATRKANLPASRRWRHRDFTATLPLR